MFAVNVETGEAARHSNGDFVANNGRGIRIISRESLESNDRMKQRHIISGAMYKAGKVAWNSCYLAHSHMFYHNGRNEYDAASLVRSVAEVGIIFSGNIPISA